MNRERRQLTCYVPESVQWRIDNLIEVFGDGRGMELEGIAGKNCRVEIQDDEFNGKTVSRIIKFLPSKHNSPAPYTQGTQNGRLWEESDCPI